MAAPATRRLVPPWRRLIAAERKPIVFGRLIAQRSAQACGRTRAPSPQRLGQTRRKLPGDRLQLPDSNPKAEHQYPGASHDRAREQQGVTEAEVQFDSETDRHEAGHQKADPGDQHHNHHRITFRLRLEMRVSRLRHDTVILCASPTDNCPDGSPRASRSAA
jgi:hypothetical protein